MSWFIVALYIFHAALTLYYCKKLTKSDQTNKELIETYKETNEMMNEHTAMMEKFLERYGKRR